MIDKLMEKVDAVVQRFHGQAKGWEDVCDYAHADPAVLQERAEFVQMLQMIIDHGALCGKCLQLGLGPHEIASHEMWQVLFSHVTTIDFSAIVCDDQIFTPGASTHSEEAFDLANRRGPYDFLFIDAGHSYSDVRQDYLRYGPMVKNGGLIAFHDALERDGFPEVKVHQFLKDAKLPVQMFTGYYGIGTAVMVQE